MITLTENAATHVRDSIIKRGKGFGIRLGVKSSGCSGFAYLLEYADELKDDDFEIESNRIRVIVSAKHVPYLDGTEVDYVKKGLNEGFEFHNPNSKGACGCGESFRVL